MGGALTVRILEQGNRVFQNLKEFVLQPQSEIWKVRQYLCESGYLIVDEDMVLEDGKFYPMMKVICGQAPEYQARRANQSPGRGL
jgi:tRNA (adenine22-N1)-methyltransferase